MAESLRSIIARRIAEEGPIAFREFMDMALYYPALGFYTTGVTRTGRSGDFLTSAAISPVFGTLVARQVAEMKRFCGAGGFTIIEYGGGNGELCRQIIRYFESDREKEAIDYVMIEKNPDTRRALSDLTPIVRFAENISEVGSFTGCVLCNELLDNFPVHRVVMEEKLMEIFVDFQNGAFTEVLREAAPELADHLRRMGVILPAGFKTEINLAVGGWLSDISNRIEKGFVLIADYGHLAGDYFHASRRNGTLACFRDHRTHDNPYEEPGAQDITAHVNFSSVALFAQAHGFGLSGFTTQDKFLRALGFFEVARNHRRTETAKGVLHEDFLTRFLLEDMGKKVKVMALQRHLPSALLTGFKPV